MKDNVAPEEKLLKLIRGAQKRESGVEAKPVAPPADARTASGQSLWQLIWFNLLFTRSYKLQKILLAAFIVSCAFFVWSLLYPIFNTADITAPPERLEENSGVDNPPSAPAKPLEYYSKAIKGHQLFKSAQSGATQPIASAAGAELLKDISLVGILMGEKPEAAIEDTKTGKVFYVSQGMFIGDCQVEEIQEGKVIVSRNGQRFEMHL